MYNQLLRSNVKRHVLNLVRGVQLSNYAAEAANWKLYWLHYSVMELSGFSIPPSSQNKTCLVQPESEPKMSSLCWFPIFFPLDFPLDHVWRQWLIYAVTERIEWHPGHELSAYKMNSTIYTCIQTHPTPKSQQHVLETGARVLGRQNVFTLLARR